MSIVQTVNSFTARYRKFLVAGVGAALLILAAVFGEGSEEVNAVIAVATAAGVYVAPNQP